MTFEVEQKYHLRDLEAFEQSLHSWGAVEGSTEQHADTYYNHPCRDFAETTEALRLRRVNTVPMITYKGPKLPGSIKARRELEWCVGPGDGDGTLTEELLESLDFKRLATVRKSRRPFTAHDSEGPFGIVIDEVQHLGLFAEIEVMVDFEGKVEPARQRIERIAHHLGLHQPEFQSYLRMVLGRKTG